MANDILIDPEVEAEKLKASRAGLIDERYRWNEGFFLQIDTAFSKFTKIWIFSP